ncbi:hypothetical protein JYK00_07410 [Thermosipho ferrireducens]|uniref:DUF2268 domain-containing protein n=1 Tax=Thermosipho ferrireducens TaxID=2571116 RepID=A0ABX7S6S7_9BACT|nr:hypothetical protein [Thermosipho ferrireducens]QTA37551.1 hypothetical protein JYK00_07410 [Thermosipho ferrireducens]
MIKIIDTFKEFKEVFQNKLDLSVDEKIDLWNKAYICKYPELENKIKKDYELYGYNWREIAKNRVFNNTKKNFKKMVQAYYNLIQVINNISKRVSHTFDLNLELYMVLYCGLCNSAGWVDKYNGKRAILLGIDKIAELEWHTKEKLEPLVAHELCHVIHFELRGEDDLPEAMEKNEYNIGIWRLYEEGFAQFYQNKLIEKDTDPRGKEWLEKCRKKKNALKKLYRQALEKEGVKKFFGDWHKILGISDVGYYLGAEFIKKLEQKYSIKEIAQLSFSTIEKEVMIYLNSNN